MIPIVFAFDNNLAMPAAVCLYSLFVNAKPTTSYLVYILYRQGEKLDTSYIDRIFCCFPTHCLKFIEIDGTFDSGYEIRGITTPAYYRLLIPMLIPEHDKVIYSDVDVIFRDDLSTIFQTELNDCFLAGVNSIANLDKDLNSYYQELKLNSSKIIYSGNLLINCKMFRQNPEIIKKMTSSVKRNFKFQDMDIINLFLHGKIAFIGPEFCFTTYIYKQLMTSPKDLYFVWDNKQILNAKQKGLIHYNGSKPWHGWCLNFDIWWEYYRKSPVFDEQFYFKFYYNRLEELDTLPLMRRVKNLVRYFVYGRKKYI